MRYGLATDCHSLSQQCNKTAAIATENRVALDIADMRAAIDTGDTMPADGLTNHLTAQTSLPPSRLGETTSSAGAGGG